MLLKSHCDCFQKQLFKGYCGYNKVMLDSVGVTIDRSRSKEQQYRTVRVIGSGTFGEVELCERKQDGCCYAIKSIMAHNPMMIDGIKQEVRSMLGMNSPYIIELVDHFYDEDMNSYILVMPFYSCGSIEPLMKKEWSLDELLLFAYQITKGLMQMEERRFLHLDVKPANILLQGDHQYVLCDLGCARRIDPVGNLAKSIMTMSYNMNISMNNQGGGTPQYSSPELLLNGQTNRYSDVWSLGVILYQLVFGRHPLGQKPGTYAYTTKMEMYIAGTFQINFCEPINIELLAIVPLLQRMLVSSKNKAMRICWREVLQNVLELAQIPPSHHNFIVTDYDSLLQLVNNSSVLLSALLHYADQLKPFLAGRIEMQPLIKEICVYLLTMTKQLVTHTKDIKQDFWEFFLFDSTRLSLTQKQINYAAYLQKQAQNMTKRFGVLSEIGHSASIRSRLVSRLGNLHTAIESIREQPRKMDQRIMLKKMQQISYFVGRESRLQLGQVGPLRSQVQRLINS